MATAVRPRSPVVLATFWMVGALLSFLTLAIAARQATFSMGVFEILFFRGVFSLLLIAPLLIKEGRTCFHTNRMKLHTFRSVAHLAAQFCWVAGVALLPLAEVFALEFTLPIWVAIMSVLWLGEKVTTARILAVVGGFIGVLILLRPGVTIMHPASILVLFAALGFAVQVVSVKFLSKDHSPAALILFMTLIQLPLSLVPIVLNGLFPEWTAAFGPTKWAMELIPNVFSWSWPGLTEWPWLVLIAVAGTTAHYAQARALRLTDVSIAMPIDFLRLPLVAFAGALLYREPLDLFVFVGAFIIFLANYNLVWRESRGSAS